MFGNVNNRAASADFIVDDTSIIQYNGDIKNRYTYAVGGDKYKNTKGAKFYNKCKNYNSISIEICSCNTLKKITNPNDKYWYFTEASLNNAVELAQYLMKQYNIPADHLIRHWDVNGKACPGIFGWNGDSGNEAEWIKFKNRVLNKKQQESPVTFLPSFLKKEQEEEQGGKDDLTMDINEFISKITNEQAYQLIHKAYKYMEQINEPTWSVEEGAWDKASKLKIVDGKNPEGFAKRDEIIAILDRLGVIQ